MYYCGLLKNTKTIEVFYSKDIPTIEFHGNFYGYIFGGYSTKEKAFKVGNYQYPYNTIRFHDNRKKECKINHYLYAIARIE